MDAEAEVEGDILTESLAHRAVGGRAAADVAQDDGASRAQSTSSCPTPQPEQRYRRPANDRTALLVKHDTMSHSYPPSPVEIAGFEGRQGSSRPWLSAHRSRELAWWETPSVWWLLPPLVLYCLAMGAVSVPKLNVILNLICHQYGFDQAANNQPASLHLRSPIGPDNKQCQTAEVHAILGRFMLYAHVISGLLCAFSSPRLGELSDRYGRKVILAITALGMLLGDVITITAASFPDQVSVYWILSEFAFGGLAGSFIATMAVIQSYAADCTEPARRSVVFGYVHGCMYAGTALGPVLGGLVVKATGNILTIFYVAFGCHLFFILVVCLVIPESLGKERQQIARERHRRKKAENTHRPWRVFLSFTNIFSPLGILRPRPDKASSIVRKNLLLLSAVDTVVFGVTLGSVSLLVMYSEYTFKWGNFESSVFVSIANSSRVFMLVAVLPIVVSFHRRRQRNESSDTSKSNSDSFDISTIRIAVFFDVLGYVGYAISPDGIVFILAGVLASVGGIASPTLQSALTTHIPPDRTGQLLGAISLLHALSRVAVPAALQLVYSLTVGTASSLVFWCLTVVFGLALAAAWGIRPRPQDGGGEYERL